MSALPDVTRDRHLFIGSSDAAAALNMSPWRTAVGLWLEKRGEALPIEESAAMRWGKLLEPVLREEYAALTGRTVRTPPDLFKHREFAFIGAHPDGIADDERLVELKTARTSDGWGEPGTDQIPDHYLLQVQHLLMVLQLRVADVAVLVGGSDFLLFTVAASPELQRDILQGEVAFWEFVESGTPPPIDYQSPGALRIVKQLYPGTNGLTIDADAQCIEYREQFEAAKEMIDAGDQARDSALAKLLAVMGESALLRFPDGRALRRQFTKRKAYGVAASEFVATRWVKA